MGTKSQPKNKAITVTQVIFVALFPATAGGIYGFFTGGIGGMVILFSECFIAGFILSYIGASFIELFRR